MLFDLIPFSAQVISLDDPDEHVGLQSNHISDQLGLKVMHIFVQNGTDNEYWGPLTFEERLGFLLKDFPFSFLVGSRGRVYITSS